MQILRNSIKYFKERRKNNIHYFWFSENPEVQALSYFRKEEKHKIF